MVWLWLSRNFVCPWALGVSGFTGIWRVGGKDGEGDGPSSGAGIPDAEDVIFPSHPGPSTCPTQESSFFFFLSFLTQAPFPSEPHRHFPSQLGGAGIPHLAAISGGETCE